jgi:hypothetical protein
MITGLLLRPRNCTIRRLEHGQLPVASTPGAPGIRRLCCPTGQRWLQGDLITTVSVRRAQNCTTRRAGAGRSPVASTMRGAGTRQLCFLMEWYLLREDWIFPPSTQARNCTTPVHPHRHPLLQQRLHLALHRHLLLHQEPHPDRVQLRIRGRQHRE